MGHCLGQPPEHALQWTYWSMLSALHQGVEFISFYGCDVTKPAYSGFFAFANRYAGWFREPQRAPGAWIAFRDVEGGSFLVGDYEYLIEQIEPENTLGLFSSADRLLNPGADPVTPLGPNTQKEGLWARRTQGQPIYLNVDDTLAATLTGQVTVRVSYFDNGTGRFQLVYEDASGVRRTHSVQKANSRLWKDATVTLPSARLANGLDKGADLLLDPVGDDDVFHMVEIGRVAAPPPPPPPPPPPAGCTPTGGAGGLAPGRYLTTVAGLNAAVVVPPGYNPARPTYLGFFIHGDGAVYDGFVKASNPVTQFVTARNWILVSPLSPNGQSWWANRVGDHNLALARVFDEMFARYNVCRNVVFGATGSGGSEFWTSYFFPAKGGTYPAHTVVACGGNDGHDSLSRQQILTLGRNPNVVARSTFDFVYGTADRLVPGILQAIELYSRAGFDVPVEAIPQGGHCNKWKAEGRPTFHEQIRIHWGRMADELGVP
jgi:hypothetical protein